MKKEIALKTAKGLDIYMPRPDDRWVHRHLPAYLESFYSGMVLNESDLLKYIGPGEVFETSYDIFVNSGHGIKSFSKESLYGPALEILVSEVERLHSIENFASLRASQKERVIEFLKELLYNMSETHEVIRIPIFATYRYNEQDGIPQDEISQYIEINFSSTPWSDFLEKIDFDHTLCDSVYVYSALVKQMIGKRVL